MDGLTHFTSEPFKSPTSSEQIKDSGASFNQSAVTRSLSLDTALIKSTAPFDGVELQSRASISTPALTVISGNPAACNPEPVWSCPKTFTPFEAENARDALQKSGLTPSKETLGQPGGTAVVEKYSTDGGNCLAAKIFHTYQYTTEDLGFEKGEICALDFEDHPNLVKVHGFLLKKKKSNTYAMINSREILTEEIKKDYHIAAIISDIAPGKELFELVSDNDFVRALDNQMITKIGSDVANAVEHLSCKGMVHRDIKSENIVVNVRAGKAAAKLIDYGTVKNIGNGRTNSFCGTEEVFSPDQWKLTDDRSATYSYPCDAWGLGCVLLESFTGMIPSEYRTHSRRLESGTKKMDYRAFQRHTEAFADLSDDDKKNVIKKAAYWSIPGGIDDELLDITAGLLRRDETQRLTVSEAAKQLSGLSIKLDSDHPE